MTYRTSPRRAVERHRAGVLLSAELLFVLPILTMFLCAIVEYGLLAMAGQRLQVAARAGARAASLPYADAGQRKAAIQDTVERGLVSPPLIRNYTLDYQVGAHTGDPVEVKLTVPMTAAAPNLLQVFCVSLEGRTLSARAVMRKE